MHHPDAEAGGLPPFPKKKIVQVIPNGVSIWLINHINSLVFKIDSA